MNRIRRTAVTAIAAASVWAPAAEATPHTVQPGESLWSIASANGISTDSLAAANGLSPDSHVVIGTTIEVPAATAAPTTAGTESTATTAPAPLGGYTVQPGDTLSGIAARIGASADEVAWMNGLDPAAPLISGTALKLPTNAPTATTAPAEPTASAPYPTSGSTTADEIASVASAHGVPGSLAAAIAWQESGFNNAMVSSANARGVMQVMPGTWTWVEQNLAGGTLDPTSAHDNVRAGVLYLGQLLRDTGGDETMAVAAYYQGLSSVRTQGMLPETERYVANVMALRSRFGG